METMEKIKQLHISNMLNMIEDFRKFYNFQCINKLNIYSDPDNRSITIDANINMPVSSFKLKTSWHGKNILALEMNWENYKEVLLIQLNVHCSDWIIVSYKDNSHTEIKLQDYLINIFNNANKTRK